MKIINEEGYRFFETKINKFHPIVLYNNLILFSEFSKAEFSTGIVSYVINLGNSEIIFGLIVKDNLDLIPLNSGIELKLVWNNKFRLFKYYPLDLDSEKEPEKVEKLLKELTVKHLIARGFFSASILGRINLFMKSPSIVYSSAFDQSPFLGLLEERLSLTGDRILDNITLIRINKK